MMEGLQSFQNIVKIPELKRRVLVTLGLLAAYRLGAHVPTPGIDAAALASLFNQMQSGLLGALLDEVDRPLDGLGIDADLDHDDVRDGAGHP